jgi:hypothetical protein
MDYMGCWHALPTGPLVQYRGSAAHGPSRLDIMYNVCMSWSMIHGAVTWTVGRHCALHSHTAAVLASELSAVHCIAQGDRHL